MTEYQAAYEHGQAAEIKVTSIQGVDHAIIPEKAKLHDFARLMPAPDRIKAAHTFHDINSFAAYFAEFAEEGTRIFVDEKSSRFTAVFDCDHKNKPAWGDHRIDLKLDKATEWGKFCSFNNKRLSQRDFSEFVEDSVDYIMGPGEFTGARMLEVAQNIAIDIKGSFKCVDTMVEGLKVLNIQDDSTASAQIGDKKITIPPTLELALRVFKGSKSYQFSSHLRHRANKEGIVFWITIPDIERVEELAFENVVKQVSEACGREVLRGCYGSNY